MLLLFIVNLTNVLGISGLLQHFSIFLNPKVKVTSPSKLEIQPLSVW